MKKVKSNVGIGILMAFAPPFVQEMVEINILWEQRQIRWQNKWNEDVSYLYFKGGLYAHSLGFSDLTNVSQGILGEQGPVSVPLKRLLEMLLGKRLPDINPQKCIEYAKVTPFSAENWYQGCTYE